MVFWPDLFRAITIDGKNSICWGKLVSNSTYGFLISLENIFQNVKSLYWDIGLKENKLDRQLDRVNTDHY